MAGILEHRPADKENPKKKGLVCLIKGQGKLRKRA